MTKKSDRYTFILNYFSKAQPDVESELNYSNAYELLVSTMLAAQCTDKRVNMVTPALFAAYPTPQALASASSLVAWAVCPSCHKNSEVRKKGRVRISQRITLHH